MPAVRPHNKVAAVTQDTTTAQLRRAVAAEHLVRIGLALPSLLWLLLDVEHTVALLHVSVEVISPHRASRQQLPPVAVRHHLADAVL